MPDEARLRGSRCHADAAMTTRCPASINCDASRRRRPWLLPRVDEGSCCDSQRRVSSQYCRSFARFRCKRWQAHTARSCVGGPTLIHSLAISYLLPTLLSCLLFILFRSSPSYRTVQCVASGRSISSSRLWPPKTNYTLVKAEHNNIRRLSVSLRPKLL